MSAATSGARAHRQTPAEDRPKVLYLAGAHRSGTTMFNSVLGAYDGVFAAGELHEIWDNQISGRPCGCGRPLGECPVWAPILDEVFENVLPPPLGPEDAVRWRAQSARAWHVGRMLRNAPGGDESSAAFRYATLMSELYGIIARRTGSRLVVDSTKVPSGAALLATRDDLESYVMHLVRDPRATAYSWSKRKTRQIAGWEETLMEAGPLNSAMQWLAYNLLAERVSGSCPTWSRLRYEDLVADPRLRANEVVSWLGVEPENDPFEDDERLRPSESHTIAGNPDRFEAGTIRVRPDERWLREMKGRDRLLVTTVCLPLLRRYGYPLTTS